MAKVKLGETQVLELEEELLETFEEKCGLLDLPFKKTKEGNLQLAPYLSGKTIVLYNLNESDIISRLVLSLKESLAEHDALCLVSNIKNPPRAIKILDAQLILCFSQTTNETDCGIKIYTASIHTEKTRILASRIIKNIITSGTSINYSIASWWERLIKVKYWPFYNSAIPTVLIELYGSKDLKEHGPHLESAIITGILDTFKNKVKNEETRCLIDLIKDNYTEIKNEKNIQSKGENPEDFSTVKKPEEELPEKKELSGNRNLPERDKENTTEEQKEEKPNSQKPQQAENKKEDRQEAIVEIKKREKKENNTVKEKHSQRKGAPKRLLRRYSNPFQIPEKGPFYSFRHSQQYHIQDKNQFSFILQVKTIQKSTFRRETSDLTPETTYYKPAASYQKAKVEVKAPGRQVPGHSEKMKLEDLLKGHMSSRENCCKKESKP